MTLLGWHVGLLRREGPETAVLAPAPFWRPHFSANANRQHPGAPPPLRFSPGERGQGSPRSLQEPKAPSRKVLEVGRMLRARADPGQKTAASRLAADTGGRARGRSFSLNERLNWFSLAAVRRDFSRLWAQLAGLN